MICSNYVAVIYKICRAGLGFVNMILGTFKIWKFGPIKAKVHLGVAMENFACFLRSSNWTKFGTRYIHANLLKSYSFLEI
jgi:hypothetical protein